MRRFAFIVVGAGSLALAGQALAETDSDTFTVTATTQDALSVTCDRNLRFGDLAVDADNTGGSTVEIAASDTTTATLSGNIVQLGADVGSARCIVNNVKNAGSTASLSGGTGTPGPASLTGVVLDDIGTGTGTLSADLTLSSGTVAVGTGDTNLFIGGTLTIPEAHDAIASTYSATITLTVTD